MAKYILGLEVGNTNIKLLECKKKGVELIIEKSQILPTLEGAVQDGMIIEVDQVYNAICEAIQKGKYKSKEILAVITSSEIITRDIRMESMPRRDMEAILALQYQEHLLVDVEAYQVTYKIVKKAPKEGGEQELLIVAAPNKIVFPLLDLAKKLKMRMRAINIASDAIASLFSQGNLVIATVEEIMIIDIGGKSTTVTIISGGIGVLNRDIPFGLDAINELIVHEIASKNIKEIEAFKASNLEIYVDEIEVGEKRKYMSRSIKSMIEYQLVSEIQRFLQFYFSRGNNKILERVYIVGGGAYLSNIDHYMTSLLEVPCIAGIKLDATQLTYNDEFEKQSAYYANILGLVSEYWGGKDE